jgi:hypothetical protein
VKAHRIVPLLYGKGKQKKNTHTHTKASKTPLFHHKTKKEKSPKSSKLMNYI